MTKNTIDDNIIFNYPIFPKLTTDIFFRQNISQFIEPMNLNENIISINEDIILKSHLGGVRMRQNDMINYINLCWMQMWGMTFWYCDKMEQKYRFQELLKVISKTSNHEMEIFNLLFETLAEHGTNYMILKLYNILIQLKLNPSLKVHNIAMKILDGVKGDGNLNDNLQRVIKSEEGKVYNNNNFRKRTLKSKYFKNILTEDVLFYAFDTCMGMDCQNEINLLTVSQEGVYKAAGGAAGTRCVQACAGSDLYQQGHGRDEKPYSQGAVQTVQDSGEVSIYGRTGKGLR